MYIAPNSTIKILKNVPLDSSYEHTIYFSQNSTGIGVQTAYFASLSKYTLSNQSYQRVKKGWMRVNIVADDLYDCNYLMFQNTNFGTKWFYAFIKTVEYINNAVSEIEFEIDVLQTWLLEYQLDKCFVEREHTDSDRLFEHTVAENLMCGGEYYNNGYDFIDLNDLSVVVAHTGADGAGTGGENYSPQGSFTDNVYQALDFSAIPTNRNDPTGTAQTINGLLDYWGARNIKLMYEAPEFLSQTSPPPPTITKTVHMPSALNNYQPKNNKLFTYPYSVIGVSNNCGNMALYHWEDFFTLLAHNGVATFAIDGSWKSTPVVLCYPVEYKRVLNNYEEGITYTNFPVVAWTENYFNTWWAENQNSFITNSITSAISAGIGGAITGGKVGGAAGAAAIGAVNVGSSIANSVAKIEDLKAVAPHVHGNTQTDTLNCKLNRVGFTIYSLSIKAEYAKIIDDYFTKFGYACKRLKVPNTHSRPHWCYTKTIGCTITGSLPCDDLKKIENIFNEGITFWMHGNEVGNYALDNTPATP